MKTLIVLLLLNFSFCFNLTYQEFLDSTPTKYKKSLYRFGLITVTYSANKDYSFFRNHLEKYATMECDIMEEIVIVWNNDETPE